MYDRNYYAQVDDAMMKLWKDFGRRLLHVLDGTMRYVLTLPIRTYEWHDTKFTTTNLTSSPRWARSLPLSSGWTVTSGAATPR